MPHNRKLVIGGVALTQARLPARQVAAVMKTVRDDLEREIIESGYLDGAPFGWIGLIIREGLVDEPHPHYQPVDPSDGELPLAIEIDTHRLLGASEALMKRVYGTAILRALVHAGERYGLETKRLRCLLEAG